MGSIACSAHNRRGDGVYTTPSARDIKTDGPRCVASVLPVRGELTCTNEGWEQKQVLTSVLFMYGSMGV